MTAEQAQSRRYVLGHGESRSLLGRRSSAEVWLLVGAVVVAVVLAFGVGGPAGFVLLALVVGSALAAVYVPFAGRTAVRWAPIWFREANQRRTGADRYVSGAREAGTRMDGAELDVPPPGPVGRLTWLAVPYGNADLAVLVQRDLGFYTTVLEVEGPGVGLYDTADQEALATRWGAVLRDLANGGGLVSRLQLLERCVPADPQAHDHYVAERGDPAAHPDLAGSYAELQHTVGQVVEEHHNYVVVCVRADRRLARAAKAAGGGDAGTGAVVVREVAALAGRLGDAGIRVVHGLGPKRLAAMTAAFYDPDRSLADLTGMTPRNSWPRSTRNTPDALEVNDGTWRHATAWVKAWPGNGVRVDFLAPLLVQTPGVTRTVGITMDLQPSEVALGRAMSDLTSDQAQAMGSAKSGRTADPRDARQMGQAEQRAHDLAQGAGGVRLAGYVTVSARDADTLEEHRRVVQAAAARSWLVLEWCDREHDRAFCNTLPLARGLA